MVVQLSCHIWSPMVLYGQAGFVIKSVQNESKWPISEISQTYLMKISWMSSEYLRHISGISQIYLRYISGTSSSFPRQISSKSHAYYQACLRHIAGVSQTYFIDIPGISHAILGQISGIFRSKSSSRSRKSKWVSDKKVGNFKISQDFHLNDMHMSRVTC